jgi:ligand-binding SRPBCC domain-containing protein
MKTLVFESEQWLPLPPNQAFPFIADAFKLELITPPILQFRVLTPPSIGMQAGTVIDYRLKQHGIPLHWQGEITVWESPFRFVDVQRRGPYRLWRHEHTFINADAGTLAHEYVDYAVLGVELVTKLLVEPDLNKIFAYPKVKFRELLAGEEV